MHILAFLPESLFYKLQGRIRKLNLPHSAFSSGNCQWHSGWIATTMIGCLRLVRHLSMATSPSNSQPAGLVETAIREKVTTILCVPKPIPSITISDQCSESETHQLTKLLQPSELIINNDSWQHRHHAAMRVEGGGNGETRMYFHIWTYFQPNSFSQTFLCKLYLMYSKER